MFSIFSACIVCICVCLVAIPLSSHLFLSITMFLSLLSLPTVNHRNGGKPWEECEQCHLVTHTHTHACRSANKETNKQTKTSKLLPHVSVPQAVNNPFSIGNLQALTLLMNWSDQFDILSEAFCRSFEIILLLCLKLEVSTFGEFKYKIKQLR